MFAPTLLGDYSSLPIAARHLFIVFPGRRLRGVRRVDGCQERATCVYPFGKMPRIYDRDARVEKRDVHGNVKSRGCTTAVAALS